jgi:hypothetical protein
VHAASVAHWDWDFVMPDRGMAYGGQGFDVVDGTGDYVEVLGA